jgi:hypothetical protein
MVWVQDYSLLFLQLFFYAQYMDEDYVFEDNPNPWIAEDELP